MAEAEAGARGVQNALQHSESRTEVLREEVQAWKTKCHDAKERASTLATETASLAAALASLQSELDQVRTKGEGAVVSVVEALCDKGRVLQRHPDGKWKAPHAAAC